MIREVQTSNHSFYSHSTGEDVYHYDVLDANYNRLGFYREINGQKLIEIHLANNQSSKLLSIDKTGSDVLLSLTGLGTINDIFFYNDRYYLSCPQMNQIRTYDTDFNIVSAYSFECLSNMFKYKDKWFIIRMNSAPINGFFQWSIYRYSSDEDGYFNINNLDFIFDNGNSFNNNFTSEYNHRNAIQPMPIINYNRGELLAFTNDSVNITSGYTSYDFCIHVFDLDKMAEVKTNIGNFYKRDPLKYTEGKIPFNLSTLNPFIYDGHYFIPEIQGPDPVQGIMRNLYIYNYDFELMMIKKMDISSVSASICCSDKIMIWKGVGLGLDEIKII